MLRFHKLGQALMVMQWFIRLVSGTANALEETVRTFGDILSGENLVLMNSISNHF